jgi:hypothetical protein
MPTMVTLPPQTKIKSIGSAYVRERFLFHAAHVRMVIITLERRPMNKLDIGHVVWILTFPETQSKYDQD